MELGYCWYDVNTGNSGINLPSQDLTINLIGTNTLTNEYTVPLTLRDQVNATITGDGSLNVVAINNNNRDEDGNAYGFNAIQQESNSTLTIAGNAKVTAEMRGAAMVTHYDGDTCLGEYTAWLDAIQGCGDGKLIIKDKGYLKPQGGNAPAG